MQVVKKYKTLFDKTKKQYCYIYSDEIRYSEYPMLQDVKKRFAFYQLTEENRNYVAEHCYIKHLEVKITAYVNINEKYKSPQAKEGRGWSSKEIQLVNDWINSTPSILQRKFFPQRSLASVRSCLIRERKKLKHATKKEV